MFKHLCCMFVQVAKTTRLASTPSAGTNRNFANRSSSPGYRRAFRRLVQSTRTVLTMYRPSFAGASIARRNGWPVPAGLTSAAAIA